jgi:hypothetical protein
MKRLKLSLWMSVLWIICSPVGGHAQGTSPENAIRINLPTFQDAWLLQLKMGETYAVPLRKKDDVVWYTFNLEDDLVIYLGQKGTMENKTSVELLDQTRKRVWISGERDTIAGSVCNEKLKKGTYFIKVTSIIFSPKPFQIEVCKFSKAQTEAGHRLAPPKKGLNAGVDGRITINGKEIPTDLTISNFAKLFGKPSRIDKRDRGTIYVQDSLGMTYRTNVGSDDITNITLYLQDMSAVWPFSPRTLFRGSLIVYGRTFPLGKTVSEVTKVFPEFKAIPGSYNVFHSAEFGTQNVMFVLDEHGKMQSISISLRDKLDTPKSKEGKGTRA